ncbi:MAG: transcriptional regulator NrdR [Sphaerochaetaceae bacterium]|nr:transcriptional regulator NrdR [Sphaerochaetaceae bacterium]MDX9809355.1 transcriptional regulator NrdR [Sphaerochaetaceae bacterium]NLV85002.1 transcriptional repressor NrdR [Spirochaetales bacterium]
MLCPHCGHMHDKVLESRQNSSGSTVRRRRECLACGYRFTSYERIEEKPLMVIKRDGRRELFDIRKVERGIRITTEKRNISQETIEEILQGIEDEVQLLAGAKREISSAAIGEAALRQLYKVDTVAYVRFASVYRAFDNVDQFIEEIERITHNME